MKNDIVFELQDLQDLNWTKFRLGGAGGACLKAVRRSGSARKPVYTYYKLSRYDRGTGIIGHESVNEIIAARLMDVLGIEHLDYTLIHGIVSVDGEEYVTWLCSSPDYRKPGESKCSLEQFYLLEKEENETPYDFCVRQGWAERIHEMLLIDYLIANRDRHGSGIEVIKSCGSSEMRLAPLCDHGSSLLYQCRSDRVAESLDPLRDVFVNSFIGGKSSQENLKLLPSGYIDIYKPLTAEDLDLVLDGPDVILSGAFIRKIKEMILERWKVYEDICHKG